MRMKFSLYILFIIISLFLPKLILAQFSGYSIEETLSLSIRPQFPKPNEEISMTITNYSADLKSMNIQWFLNNSPIESGVGLTSTSVKLGGSGSSNVIRVVATKPNGAAISATQTIRPYDLNIFAEADTYTPPFYKGKALASKQSSYKFIAIPEFFDGNGNKIPNQNIVFTWKIGDVTDQRNSGPGKDTYFYANNLISRPVTVTLTASPVNSSAKSQSSKIFDFDDPVVIFYEENPVLGTIWERAMPNEINLTANEVSIRSEAYFFDKNSVGLVRNDWSLNGKKIEDIRDKTITFRQSENRPGTAEISVAIKNPLKSLQFSSKNLKINFDGFKN